MLADPTSVVRSALKDPGTPDEGAWHRELRTRDRRRDRMDDPPSYSGDPSHTLGHPSEVLGRISQVLGTAHICHSLAQPTTWEGQPTTVVAPPEYRCRPTQAPRSLSQSLSKRMTAPGSGLPSGQDSPPSTSCRPAQVARSLSERGPSPLPGTLVWPRTYERQLTQPSPAMPPPAPAETEKVAAVAGGSETAPNATR